MKRKKRKKKRNEKEKRKSWRQKAEYCLSVAEREAGRTMESGC